ncbi:hypothetical protein AB4Z55_26335 [Gordonia sp. ABKF26]|jgi:hypothetical protein|uniref:hypothetical protein n=1 Tax=Gordonia sp. ABKF26 TaxID=3238687 RepID=UPI0034E50D4D
MIANEHPEIAEPEVIAATSLVEREIGPRVVGGRYKSAYREREYEVLAISRSPELLCGWNITVQHVDRPGPTTHATAWDAADEIVHHPRGQTHQRARP